jgi:hypothetical protein
MNIKSMGGENKKNKKNNKNKKHNYYNQMRPNQMGPNQNGYNQYCQSWNPMFYQPMVVPPYFQQHYDTMNYYGNNYGVNYDNNSVQNNNRNNKMFYKQNQFKRNKIEKENTNNNQKQNDTNNQKTQQQSSTTQTHSSTLQTQQKKDDNKKIFSNVIGFGKPLSTQNTTQQSQQSQQSQSQSQKPKSGANILDPYGGNGMNSFGGLFGGPEIVKIDIIGPKGSGKGSGKENDMVNKHLSDIFKALLGIPMDLAESESELKLKIKEFDLEKDYVEIDKNIKTIDDLLELSNLYDSSKPELMEKYTIDLKKLFDMKEPLNDLKNMIGMESVKKSVVRQVLYFLQGIEEQQDMLHMIITGSPGIGKTSLGVILAKLYYSMGILDSKPSINPLTGKQEDFIFKIYKRADLIGQYLGHTAIKTQKAIDECIGGVMFLDEAYSLGHEDKSDIYTKECLDTINQNLSENKKNFILIIAGYPDQLDKCFFSHNEGLKRRFAFRYDIEKYTSKELAEMLCLKIKQNKWKLDENVLISDITKLIDSNKENFKNFGGDIESWLLHIKIEHGVRIFGKHPKYRRLINMNDMKNGLEQFKLAKQNKNEIEKEEIQKRIRETLYC